MEELIKVSWKFTLIITVYKYINIFHIIIDSNGLAAHFSSIKQPGHGELGRKLRDEAKQRDLNPHYVGVFEKLSLNQSNTQQMQEPQQFQQPQFQQFSYQPYYQHPQYGQQYDHDIEVEPEDS